MKTINVQLTKNIVETLTPESCKLFLLQICDVSASDSNLLAKVPKKQEEVPMKRPKTDITRKTHNKRKHPVYRWTQKEMQTLYECEDMYVNDIRDRYFPHRTIKSVYMKMMKLGLDAVYKPGTWDIENKMQTHQKTFKVVSDKPDEPEKVPNDGTANVARFAHVPEETKEYTIDDLSIMQKMPNDKEALNELLIRFIKQGTLSRDSYTHYAARRFVTKPRMQWDIFASYVMYNAFEIEKVYGLQGTIYMQNGVLMVKRI